MLKVVEGDITKLQVDAIVNAANTSLMGGGGVDGAIHGAAGRELVLECMLLNGCKVGEAKATPGFKLPAKYVIHAVGPFWRGGQNNEPELLASSYRHAVLVAELLRVKTLAFPCISCGIFGYPIDLAAPVAIQTIKDHIEKGSYIEEITFCCYTAQDANIYRNLLV